MNELPAYFTGHAPIFAIPDAVFFPGTRISLHVFEPRYREMTRRALETDRLIAVGLLKPGWEKDYEGNPPIHAVCTLGQIIMEEALPDGRWNIVLEGLARFQPAQLVQEIPYRIAKGRLLHDVVDPLSASDIASKALHLTAVLSRLGEEDFEFAAMTSRLSAAGLPPGRLADVVAAALKVEISLKQALLEVVDVGKRLTTLLAAVTRRLEDLMLERERKAGREPWKWN